LTGSGLSESRSGFQPRAGTLTLLFLASEEDRETLVAMLVHLEAALLDPLTDPDEWDFSPEEDEEDADEEWEDDEDDEEWEDDEDDVERDQEEEDLERTLPDFGEMPAPPPSGMSVVEPGIGAIGPHTPTGLAPASRELLYVGRVLEAWLRKSPTGPLRLGEEESGIALAALISGWSSTVVHAVSGAALTMEEIESATGAVRPEVLAARVEAMEDVGLLEPLEGAGGETRYAATRWLRQSIAPLAAAARLERHQEDEDAAPPDVLDVGAAFLLTLPLLDLAADLGGSCRLGVQLPGEGDLLTGAGDLLTGATAQIENGNVVFVDLRLDPSAASWAIASPLGWLDTLVDPDEREVAFGGEDVRLPEALVAGLHEELFGGLLPNP